MGEKYNELTVRLFNEALDLLDESGELNKWKIMWNHPFLCILMILENPRLASDIIESLERIPLLHWVYVYALFAPVACFRSWWIKNDYEPWFIMALIDSLLAPSVTFMFLMCLTWLTEIFLFKLRRYAAERLVYKDYELAPYKDAKIMSYYTKSICLKKADSYGKSANKEIPVYIMESQPRGILFFVNIVHFLIDKNQKREGADADKQNLLTLFRDLGFIIFYYEDLTKNQFVDLTEKLKKSDYLNDVDSFVMCIASHGVMLDVNGNENSVASETVVEFSDGKSMGVERIAYLFSNENCKQLASKPKMFFFQCCRGAAEDIKTPIKIKRQYKSQDYQKQNDSYSVIEDWVEVGAMEDILIGFSTTPGFVSSRDPISGTWYIEELCKVIAEYAHNTHLEDMLKILKKRIGYRGLKRGTDSTQIPETRNIGFGSHVYFNPGL